MAVYTQVDKKHVNEIVEDYNLGKLASHSGITAGSVNTNYLLETSRGKFLLRIDEVKNELDVKRELDLILFLRKHAFPCPQPLADARNHHYREIGGKFATVYRWVDGKPALGDRLTPARLEAVGRALADLHTVTKSYKKGIENRFGYYRIASIYGEIRRRLPSYFKRITRTRRRDRDLRHYLESKLPKGIIHGDLFPDNLLFRGEKLVAVLDFEAASRGKFIFDLATAVNALCCDRQSYSLPKFEALIAGYESLRPLSLAEWDAFPKELRLSALRFTITRLHDFAQHWPRLRPYADGLAPQLSRRLAHVRRTVRRAVPTDVGVLPPGLRRGSSAPAARSSGRSS